MEKDEKRLTEHFRMDEFVYSAMAVEFGLNNALPSEVIPVIRNLTADMDLSVLSHLFQESVHFLWFIQKFFVNTIQKNQLMGFRPPSAQ